MFLENVTSLQRLRLSPFRPCATTALSTAAGIDTEEINLHTLLFGTVLRPAEAWRINGDLELLYADNAFTDFSPRHQQRLRAFPPE